MDRPRATETIPILVSGKSLLCTVTRYTTSDDVIRMATGYRQTPFGLYESAYGIERQLSDRTRIQKLVRSWGSDRNNYSLAVREINQNKMQKTKMSRLKRKMQKLRPNVGTAQERCRTLPLINESIRNNIDTGVVDKSKLYTKDVNIQNISKQKRKNSGKLELMKRFLRDAQEYRNYHEDKDRQASGIVTIPRTSDDRDGSWSSDDDTGDSVLNNAFILHSNVDDMGGCVTDLNDTVIYRGSPAAPNQAHHQRITDGDHVEGEVTPAGRSRRCAEIQDMFSNVCASRGKEFDDDIESFMKTIVVEGTSDDVDEGLSSMGSDVIWL